MEYGLTECSQTNSGYTDSARPNGQRLKGRGLSEYG